MRSQWGQNLYSENLKIFELIKIFCKVLRIQWNVAILENWVKKLKMRAENSQTFKIATKVNTT